MSLMDLFQPAARPTVHRALLMLACSALLMVGQLALLNRAVIHPDASGVRIGASLALAASFVAAFFLRSRGALRVMNEVESALFERRRRIFAELRAAELRAFERLGELRGGVTGDIEEIEARMPVIVDCLVYALMLVGFGLYLAVLTPKGAVVWLITIGLLGWRLRAERQSARRTGAELDRKRLRHRRLVDDFVRGFAQLKMDPAASAALRAEAAEAGQAADAAASRHFRAMYQAPVVATTIYFLGFMLFEPVSAAIAPEIRFEVVTVLFLSFASLIYLTREIHALAETEAALARLDALEATLTEISSPVAGSEDTGRGPLDFERIELRGVTFSYGDPARPTFTVGPIDLSLSRGEVVFITGTNGSGKTTLMKLLTGLYPPDHGALWLDGRRVSPSERAHYADLFSSVFMDHHLFGQPYGLDVTDPERVEALLLRFNLAGVVRFEGGRFTPLDLSTGQRKRLAMVVALLEDRPIYVLDEWAAHQDPELRRYFYTTLVPEMRAAGKTVVAISHDARFFHLADRRLHLVDGRLVAAHEATPWRSPP